MTFTGTNFNNTKRRASFGRRVSFSTVSKVKEFRTDDRDFTIWNSTYEEEKSNLKTDSSDCSSQKTEGEDDVFAEKSFIAPPNDEEEQSSMDMTCAVQKVL